MRLPPVSAPSVQPRSCMLAASGGRSLDESGAMCRTAQRAMAAYRRSRHNRTDGFASTAPGRPLGAGSRGLVDVFVADRAGQALAWAVIADQHGGTRVPGELQANTLDQLRAMLPAGLTRR